MDGFQLRHAAVTASLSMIQNPVALPFPASQAMI
jgi:hypothetical protein